MTWVASFFISEVIIITQIAPIKIFIYIILLKFLITGAIIAMTKLPVKFY